MAGGNPCQKALFRLVIEFIQNCTEHINSRLLNRFTTTQYHYTRCIVLTTQKNH